MNSINTESYRGTRKQTHALSIYHIWQQISATEFEFMSGIGLIFRFMSSDYLRVPM